MLFHASRKLASLLGPLCVAIGLGNRLASIKSEIMTELGTIFSVGGFFFNAVVTGLAESDLVVR